MCGCSKTDPSLVAVTGTVTINDQPLANATVTFIPKDGTPGFGGVGKTDAAGKSKLFGNRDDAPGILPGEYRVVVSKRLMPDGSEVPANGEHAADEFAGQGERAGRVQQPGGDHLERHGAARRRAN